MNQNYPNDADGDALRNVAEAGNDMSQPMGIDFTVAVPDESVGRQVAELAQATGYAVELVFDDEDAAWTCYCTKTMLATYDGVVQAQEELNELAEPLGAYCDGWGTFGNSEPG